MEVASYGEELHVHCLDWRMRLCLVTRLSDFDPGTNRAVSEIRVNEKRRARGRDSPPPEEAPVTESGSRATKMAGQIRASHLAAPDLQLATHKLFVRRARVRGEYDFP